MPAPAPRKSIKDVFYETRVLMGREYWAPLVHVFWPVIRQWSPASSHFICREARSEPAVGSE